MKNQDDYLREQIEQLKAQQAALESYARTATDTDRAQLLADAHAHLQGAIVAIATAIALAKPNADARFIGLDTRRHTRAGDALR